MRNSDSVQILLTEDDLVDQKAFLRAFKQLKIANPVILAKDGVAAWQELQGEGELNLDRPFLVVLDINMPRMNGIELLREIRKDEHLHDTICFVLTTSNDERDKLDAYDLNATGYLLKSDMGNSFIRAVEMVENYWRVVELPTKALA